MQPVEFSLTHGPKTVQQGDDPAQRSAQRVLEVLKTCKTIGVSTAHYAAIGAVFGGLGLFSCAVGGTTVCAADYNFTKVTENIAEFGSETVLAGGMCGGFLGAMYGFGNGLIKVMNFYCGNDINSRYCM